MTDGPPSDHRPETAPIDDPVERVIAEALELPEGEWGPSIERACADHPEYADRIRRRALLLQRSGLLVDEAPPASGLREGIPERLGDFRLLRELGGGGMGVVYLAEQSSRGREVALKLVRPDQLYFPGSRKRFQRELSTIARLKHPSIVPVHAVGESQGIAYLAMEYIRGATLADVLQTLQDESPDPLDGRDLFEAVFQKAGEQGEDLPLPEAYQGTWTEACLRVFAQVAEALHHAHERGVIHRDVKPGNIMLTTAGLALLVDFGLSRSEGTSRMTRTGVALGSLPYMAPEQVRGDVAIDHRADVYSLGVTLYELLTLKAPFRSRDAERLRQQILRGSPASLRSLNRDVPPDVERVCLKAMDREPAQRYASAAELAADLRNALNSNPVAARRGSSVLRTMRLMRRHPVMTAVLLLLLAQVVVTQALIFFNIQRERDQYEVQRDSALVALEAAHSAQEQTQLLRGEAEQALQETRRLLEASWLRSLPLEAEDIQPVNEDNIPVLDHWLERARVLLEQRAEVRADFDAVQTRLEQASNEEERGELRSSLGRLQSTLQQMDRLNAFYQRMLQDRDFAATVRWQSVESPDAQAAWQDAIDDVFLMEIYDGLELVPQEGLLPLGKDPETGLWEFLHLQSGAPPQRSENSVNPWVITPETGVVMVLVPGGVFRMGAQTPSRAHPLGSPNVDPNADLRESPVQAIALDAFFLAKYELTQSQWKRLALSNDYPSFVTSENQALPVESIAHTQTRSVLARAGLLLPTEAQWEYACRAGTTTVYFGGNAPESLLGFVNYADRPMEQLMLPGEKGKDGYAVSAPVGSYRPNPFGLHDMLGNVAEQTRDAEGSYQTRPARAGDGLRMEASDEGWAIVRGGSYFQDLEAMRSAHRSFQRVDRIQRDVGVRPMMPVRRR